MSSFVGRSDALDWVPALLEKYRLVTITGPGGVGKTRLAAEVLARVADRFADGVWAVELTAVQDPELVPAVVASALGVRVTAGASVVDDLAAHLARQQLLLVLDNCEHVLDAASELCGKLLPAADDIKILATSREQLGLAAEARYRLAPLSLPDDGAQDDGLAEAVTLFIDRARQADPNVDVDGEARPLVERLVRRLDGMPLAIELAAARVEALGLAQLAGRLDDSFRLLVSVNRAAAPRQRSLAAMVDWSYQLLAEPERRVFRFLSVFPAPFTLAAAEAVAGPDAELSVLRLVDCSLLVPPRTGPDGRSRYQMLETLREFAGTSLAAGGEEQDTAKALAAYALDVAERAASQLETVGQELRAAAWLDAEYPAVRQGLVWALEHDPATALRLAVALAPWWLLRGRRAEASVLLQQAVDVGVQGTADWYAAHFWLGRVVGHFADMHRHYSLVVAELRDGPPSAVLIDAMAFRAGATRILGRPAEGAAEARAALDLARQIGYVAGEANALVELSLAALDEDRGEDAVAWARQAQQVDFSQLSDWRARGTRWVLPCVLVTTNHLDGAREACEEVLALSRAAGDRRRQVDMLILLAQLARQAGQLPEAGAFLAACAEAAFADGGHLIFLMNILDEGAIQCAAARRPAEAVTLWSAHSTQKASIGLVEADSQYRHREPLERVAREALDAQRLRAAEQRGAAMTLTAAVEFAVMMTGPNAPTPDAPAPQAVTVTAAPGPRLSARERELVALVARGSTDAEIAALLFISIRTVRSHLDRIKDKSGYRRRADLTRLALREGIV